MSTKSGIETKGAETDPVVNGSSEDSLTPELLFQMNKKIAQLTKVVYGLNTRGEELEAQLSASQQTEEKTRGMNTDLQHRVNTFKSKIETEMGKLRELETQAGQSQFWRMESENLKRRLEAAEVGLGGGETRAMLAMARDETEQSRRREKNIQYELDQARHAITNLKGHHDFIMRERDAQQDMEREKIVLEYQTTMAEMEARYKSQLRRATDDLELITEDREMLRRRLQNSSGDSAFREQINLLQHDFTEEKREWERKIRQKSEELQEGKSRHVDEKRDVERKLRALNEEKRRSEYESENKLRSVKEEYEERIKDMIDAQTILQNLIDEKDDEYEAKLKAKVVEWKTEWELTEEGLREELRKMKAENEKLRSDSKNLRFSVDRAGIEQVNRIQTLEEDLNDKRNELELKTKNFNVRVNMLENMNGQMTQEKNEFERQLENERERYKAMLRNHETLSEKAKEELRERLTHLEESDQVLKVANKDIEEENEKLRKEKEDIRRRGKEKSRLADEQLEIEKESVETKVKQKMERIWKERLHSAEDHHAQEYSKLQESSKRKESGFQKEVEGLQTRLEDSRKLHEDLKKRLRELRQKELETSKKASDSESQLQEYKKKELDWLQKMKEVEELEKRYQGQVDRLTTTLADKQQEATLLKTKLEESKEELENNNNNVHGEIEEFQKKVEELTRLIGEKDAAIEGVRVELQQSKNDVDSSKAKVRRLEDDLELLKQNSATNEEQSKTNFGTRVTELEAKIKVLEDKLEKSESNARNLQQNLDEVEEEREDEMKIVQDALDEAAQEREDLISTFKKEIEHVNDMNTAREQQMLEDFEWKLSEMEKDHKKRLSEKENQAEDQLTAARSVVESELAESVTKVAEDRRIADEKLAEVINLRSYEAEAIQLRGVTHEFQRALRASARQMENLRIKERLNEEEIKTLKTRSQSRQNTFIQRNKRHSDDEENKQKIEKMKNEINASWEDKLRSECGRLKSELEELHAEEKELAVESFKQQKEQETQAIKSSSERRVEELSNTISTLKDTLAKKESYYNKEMESARTIADGDIWQLRMKLQKLNESSFDKINQMEENYKEQIERLRTDCDEKAKEFEVHLASCRPQQEVDLMTQLTKDHKAQMQHLEEQHRLSMERLREELESDKFQAVEEARVILSKHHDYLESGIRDQLSESLSNTTKLRVELEEVQVSLSQKEEELEKLRSNDLNDLTSDLKTGVSISSGLSSSQYSLASSNDSARLSQDRLSLSDLSGVALESPEDSQKNNKSSGSLLGKFFGGGWFMISKPKDGSRRGNNPYKPTC